MSQRDWTCIARQRRLRVVGLMSGTSADGIDAAIVDISARGAKLIAFRTYPYPASVRREVLALCDPAQSTVDRICHMNFVLGELFADAVLRLADDSGVPLASIDLIGSHGQTIHHLPAGRRFGRRLVRSTLQIAEPSVIAERTGITTVADFRPRDVAAGGQGAPLVPYADYVLFAHPRLSRVLCNIGGIANITSLPAACRLEEVQAFDTGPGNMIMDALVAHLSGGRRQFDKDGRLARTGRVHADLLRELLRHPYLRRRPPKTTGREQFGATFAQKILRRGRRLRLSDADLVATATAFTAEAIARACRMLPAQPDEMILCGGGARNPVLVRMLQAAVSPTRVLIMDDLGLDADAKEAVSFAILAAETIRGRCNNVPSATGARCPRRHGKDRSRKMKDRSKLTTEMRNPRTRGVDRLDSLGIVEAINAEDALVAPAVRRQRRQIAAAVDIIVGRLQQGGRLIYVGAGTSGRLGVLDASECPPTFGVPRTMVQGIIAGGRAALVRSSEGKEDIAADGAAQIDRKRVGGKDVVCGIAACGLTPFVHGAVERARQIGAATIFITCSPQVKRSIKADVVICPVVGPEAVTGSTRMKAGTATKLVLNTLTTASMIRLGKVYDNLMVDLRATNTKLRDRAERILMAALGIGRPKARTLLEQARGQVKTAIVMHQRKLGYAASRRLLAQAGGRLAQVVPRPGRRA